MAGLTVSEKEHWKERIARRIDKKIETLQATEPNFIDRIHEQARQRAFQSLGLAQVQAELDAIDQQKEELDRREKELYRTMLATVRRVPVEKVDEPYFGNANQEVTKAIERRQAVHEDELLAEDPLGREILRLRLEKENLLDTVWLATSPMQVRELWKKVNELLGAEDTALQVQALAIEAVV
jgi:hypothetical protein